MIIFDFCEVNISRFALRQGRTVNRTLLGVGCVEYSCIDLLRFCPTSFVSNQIQIEEKLISYNSYRDIDKFSYDKNRV